MACTDDEDLLIRFLIDLTTPSERIDMSKRWACAHLLMEESQQGARQKKPYRQIADEVGAGVGTVVRAANCLQDGRGGFGDVYQRLQQQKEIGR
jgi:uncharacterized protein YerC